MNRILYISVMLGSMGNFSCHETGNIRQVSSAKDSGARKIIADFEQQLIKDVQKDTIGSISAAIFLGDKIVWAKSFGKADNQKRIEADTATIYRIGSISKTFTAYLLMLMVQRGTLSLDEPVAK